MATTYHKARVRAVQKRTRALKKRERELRARVCNGERIGHQLASVWIASRDELASRGVKVPPRDQVPVTRSARWASRWATWLRRKQPWAG